VKAVVKCSLFRLLRYLDLITFMWEKASAQKWWGLKHSVKRRAVFRTDAVNRF